MIVDVDTHWEITGDSAGVDPMKPWADQIPDNRTHLSNAIAGDLLQVLRRTGGRDRQSCCPSCSNGLRRRAGR